MGNFLEAAVAAEALAEREESEAESSKPRVAEEEKEEAKTTISVRDYIAKNKTEVERQSGLKHMLAKFQTNDMIENAPNDSKVISMRKCIEKLIESPVIMDHLTAAPQDQKRDTANAMHASMTQFRNRAASHGAESMAFSRKDNAVSLREAQLQYAAHRQSEATGRESHSEARDQRSYDTEKPVTYGGGGKNDPLRGLQKVVESKSSYIPNMKKIAAAGDPVWQVRYKEDPAKSMPDQQQMLRYHQAMKVEPQEGAMHHLPTEPGPYLSPKNEQQASRYPPLEGLRPAPPGPSIVHGTVEPMKGYPHVPDRKPWPEAPNQGPRGWERDPRWHQNMERPQMTSKMMPDNARPRMVAEDPRARMMLEDPRATMFPEDPRSRMVTDDPRSRMVPDDPRSRMVPDDPRSRMVPDDPRSRMVPDDPRSRMVPNDPRSRMMMGDPRSRVIPDDPRSRMFMNDQRSKFAYEDPRARMMSEEQRSMGMPEDQASRLDENSPKIFSSPAIDQAYKRGLQARNQRRLSYTDMNIVSPKTQADMNDSYPSRPRSKTLDQQHLRQQYLSQHQRMVAMQQNENMAMLSPGKRQEGLEPSDTVGAHLLRLAQENPMMKYERPPTSSPSGTDIYPTSSQPQFSRALPPMAIRKSEEKPPMVQENLSTHRVDYLRNRGGIGDEQIVGFNASNASNASSPVTYPKEGSNAKLIEEKFRIKPPPPEMCVDKRQTAQDEVRLRKAALAAGPVGALIYAELMAQKQVEDNKNVEKLSPGGSTTQNPSPYRKDPQEAMKMGHYYQHQQYNQQTKPQPYQTASSDMVTGMASPRDRSYETRELPGNSDLKKTLHYYPAEVELKKGAAVSQYSQEGKSDEKEGLERKRPGGESPLDLSVKKQKGNEDVQDIREAAFRREYEKFLKQQQEQNKKAFKPRDFYAARHFDDSQDVSYEENFITSQQLESTNTLSVNEESVVVPAQATGVVVTNQEINLDAEIPANDVLFIECKLCGSTYGSLPNFRRHFTKLHSGTLRRDDMIVHTISAAKNARAKQSETSGEPSQQENTNTEGLTCSQCGDQAPVHGDYTPKIWLCRECYEQFSDRDSLQRHLSVAHGLENRFRCSNCHRGEERSICQATPDSTIPNEDSQHADMEGNTKRSDVSCQANISAPKTEDDPENYSQEHTRFLKFKYPIKKMVTEKMKKNEPSQEEAHINPRKRPLEWSDDNQRNVHPKMEELEQASKRPAAENMQQNDNQIVDYRVKQQTAKQIYENKVRHPTADDVLQEAVTKSVVNYQSSDESSKESFKEATSERKLKGSLTENPYAQKDYPGALQQQQIRAQSAWNDYSPKLLQHRENYAQHQQDQRHAAAAASQNWDNFDRTRFYRRPMYAGQYVKDAIASMVASEFQDSQDEQGQSDMLKQETNYHVNTGNNYKVENQTDQERNRSVQEEHNLTERRKYEDNLNVGKHEYEPKTEPEAREEGQSSTVGCIVARLIESSIMKPNVDNSPRKKKMDKSFHEFLSGSSPNGSSMYDNTYKDNFNSGVPEKGMGNEIKHLRGSSQTEHQIQQNVNVTAQGLAKGGMLLPSSVYIGEQRPRTSQQAYIYSMEQTAGMRLQTIPCSMEQKQGTGPGEFPCNTDQNQRTGPQIYSQSAVGMGLQIHQNIQEQKADIRQQEIIHKGDFKTGTSPQIPHNVDQKSSSNTTSNDNSETGLQLASHTVDQKDISAISQHPDEANEKKPTLETHQHPNEQASDLSKGGDKKREEINKEQTCLGNENPERLLQKDQTEKSSKSELQKPEFSQKVAEPHNLRMENTEQSDIETKTCDTKVENIEQQDFTMENEESEMKIESKNQQNLKLEKEEVDMKTKMTEQNTENISVNDKKEHNTDQEKNTGQQKEIEKYENTPESESICQAAEEKKEKVKPGDGKMEAESDISNTNHTLEIPIQQDESSVTTGGCTEQTGNADCQDRSGEQSEKEAKVTESYDSVAFDQSKSYENFDDGMDSDTSGELVIDLEYNESEASDKVKGQMGDKTGSQMSEKNSDSVGNLVGEYGQPCDPSVKTHKTETQVLLSKCNENSDEKPSGFSVSGGSVYMVAETSETNAGNESEAVPIAEQSEKTVDSKGESISQLETTINSFQELEPLPSSTDGATDPKEGLSSNVTDMKQCSVVLCDASSNPHFQRFIEKK